MKNTNLTKKIIDEKPAGFGIRRWSTGVFLEKQNTIRSDEKRMAWKTLLV